MFSTFSLSIHLLMDIWVGLLAIVNNAARHRKILRFCFQFFWVHIQNWYCWTSYDNSMFNFLRNYYSIFHCSWAILYCYQQCRVPFFFISMPIQRYSRKYNIVVLVTQQCPTLWDPMGCSPPGSSVHEIFQARILEYFFDSGHPGDCGEECFVTYGNPCSFRGKKVSSPLKMVFEISK